MGLNVHRKIPLKEEFVKTCKNCNVDYGEDANFCPSCGKKLTKRNVSKVYANLGKNGISSISVKTANGVTVNSKGKATVPLAKGLSYTSNLKNK